MCNAQPQHLPILQNINSHEVPALENFLTLHQMELSCFLHHRINAEKLNAINMDLIKKHVKQESISTERLLQAGMTQSRIDELGGAEEVVCSQCNKSFQSPDEFANYQKNCPLCGPVIGDPPPQPPQPTDYYQQIRDNDFRASVDTIHEWLESGKITVQGLINNCGISEDIARRLSEGNVSGDSMSSIEVDRLPPLATNRTDFYFIGMPAAGKSCILASLLSYWYHEGLYSPDVNNPRSIEYSNVLMDPFTKGYLPNRNVSGFIDYINGSLNIPLTGSGFFGRGRTVRNIPINILDMAGEEWRKAAVKGLELPNHRKYLDNKNQKALLFVVDADADTSQVRHLTTILSYFDKWGIWAKTDSVGILISKADKLSANRDYAAIQAAVQLFYDSPKCAALRNGITNRRNSSENRFDTQVLPYSIGECRWGQFLLDPEFETNGLLMESASKLTDWILDNTGGDNSGGFGGIFSN